MHLLFWLRTMKSPIVLYERYMAKVSYFRLIRSFFSWDCGDRKSFQDPQRNGTNKGIDIIYKTVLRAGLRLPTSIWNRNYLFFNLYGKSHVIGQCHCHWRIAVDICWYQWISMDKTVEQYNNLEQVERVTRKNVFLLLLH